MDAETKRYVGKLPDIAEGRKESVPHPTTGARQK